MKQFSSEELAKLWKPKADSQGEDNGQVTIIGGSELFSGAPLLSLVAAARVVDMVYLATPETDKGAAEKTAIFSRLKSVIWVPREDLDRYIEKSDAVLIGSGMMRFTKEGSSEQDLKNRNLDKSGQETRQITKILLQNFPEKKWVIDGGSLQVMEREWIPPKAVLTPNKEEYEMLFNEQFTLNNLQLNALKYNCVIVHKGNAGYVTDGMETYEINGGNAGLTKGGTGDTLAGLTVGLLAKNPALSAAAAASYVVKRTVDSLFEKAGYNYNADDVAENVFRVMKKLTDGI